MRDGFVQRGGLWVVTQCALFGVVFALCVIHRGESKIPALVGLGLFFVTVSACCGLAGMLALGRNLSPFPKPVAKAKLVQRGIYGILRHPLYTSVSCGAIGWSLMRQSWTALAFSLVLALFLDAKARREERWLEAQFPEYADYAQRVHRFIPWVY
jgi:protein-S-isoprenylcysteine O-methyltransferase Ste14